MIQHSPAGTRRPGPQPFTHVVRVFYSVLLQLERQQYGLCAGPPSNTPGANPPVFGDSRHFIAVTPACPLLAFLSEPCLRLVTGDVWASRILTFYTPHVTQFFPSSHCFFNCMVFSGTDFDTTSLNQLRLLP